jgi:hypothetical protein
VLREGTIGGLEEPLELFGGEASDQDEECDCAGRRRPNVSGPAARRGLGELPSTEPTHEGTKFALAHARVAQELAKVGLPFSVHAADRS